MPIFHKYISRAFLGLILIMAILLGLALGLYALYLHSRWEPLLPISQALTSGTKDVILLIMGAVIASFVGILFSAWYHELELEETNKQVAAGFFGELTILKSKLMNIQHEDMGRFIFAIKMMIPLYSHDDLYYVFRKEIYSLENEIYEPLIGLYSKIIKLADIQDSLKIKNTTGYQSPQQIVDLVNSINHEIEVILPILEERKNR